MSALPNGLYLFVAKVGTQTLKGAGLEAELNTLLKSI